MRGRLRMVLALLSIGCSDLYAGSTITVVLCDKTGLNAKLRAEAKLHASRLMQSLRVDVEWFDSCEGVQRPEYMTLTLLPKAPEGWALTGSTMGRAVVLTGPFLRAYVFADAVKRLRDSRSTILGSNYATLMGHAMAHELGHLMGLSHAAHGLMKAEWGAQERREALSGTLVFAEVR